jgi:thiamine biosynthesis lipoprotein
VPKTQRPRRSTSTVGRLAVHVMGTVVSFDLRDPVSAAALEEAIRLLHHADATFSTYRSDSEISRLGRGDIRVEDCHPDVAEVLRRCQDAVQLSDGYFTAFPHGDLDPTGLVKGWAIQRSSDVLIEAGSRRHAVNGGGDVQLFGGDAIEPPWRIGIVDPSNHRELLAVALCRDGAIATSGIAERGHHIVNPMTGQLADHFLSVSITAPTLIDADVLATAAFARGDGAIEWIERLPGVEGLFVTASGKRQLTSGFPLA